MLRQTVYDVLVHSHLYVNPDPNISGKSQKQREEKLICAGKHTCNVQPKIHTQISERNSKEII